MTAGAHGASPGADAAVAHALSRAAVYRVLGGAFAYPSAPRLEDLGLGAAKAAETVAGPLALQEALGAFARAVADADPLTVSDEYVFLFDRQVPCAPYEGAYGAGPQMAGKSATLADIAGFYAAFGLTPAGAQPDTEDHIVAELEFMSALALKEAWALAEHADERCALTREAQKAFLTDHLGRWAQAFADALASATPVPYYASAAALLAEWVRHETEALGVSPSPLASRAAAEPGEDEPFSCPMAERQPDHTGGAP